MRVDPFQIAPERRQGGLDERPARIAVHADALHAGIDLQVDNRLAAQRLRGSFDLAQLVQRGHGDFQVMADEVRDLRAEDPAQHQDRHCHTGIAQRDPLLHEGHTQVLHATRLQMQAHRNQAVPIGIGLDDGHHRHAYMRSDRPQVAGNRI